MGLGADLDSYKYFKEAFTLRNETFLFFSNLGSLDPKEDLIVETLGFRLVNIAVQHNELSDVWKLFKSVSVKTDGLIEPSKRPLLRLIEVVKKFSTSADSYTSIMGHMNQIQADIKRGQLICERNADKEKFLQAIEDAKKQGFRK